MTQQNGSARPGERVRQNFSHWLDGARLDLSRAFAVLSLLSIALIFSVSAHLQSRFLTQQILLRDATVTREFIDSIVHTEGTDAHMAAETPGKPNQLLRSFLSHVLNMPDVLAANVYDASGRVILSSSPHMADHAFSDNDELSKALTGELVYETGIVGSTEKAEHANLADRHLGARFVETYVPITKNGAAPAIGVVEIYKVPVALERAIADGLTRLWLAAAASGLLLFGALNWIVRAASRRIEAQNRRLSEVEALAMIGETAAAVTHSLRNPLASIRAAAELTLSDDLEGARESARDIISETDRLTRWTKELLYFSKMPLGAPAPVDLNKLVAEVAADFTSVPGHALTRLDLNLAPDLPGVITAPEPARHVLTSILANSHDAMAGGGIITISSARSREKGRVRLSVEDTGTGLTQDEIGKAMKPFYSSKHGGTGLGLPLARQIMERFGGTVTLSNGKKGLRVDLIFKAAQQMRGES